MYDRFLDSLHGWRGVLFVLAWTFGISFAIVYGPQVLTFIVELIFPNGW